MKPVDTRAGSGGALPGGEGPTIVSWNVHQFLDRRLQPCFDACAHALASLDVDMLCCQEVLAGDGEHTAEQARRLAARLEREVEFAVNATTWRGPLGNATLSRLPAAGSSNLDLSPPDATTENRGALWVRFAREDLEVWNVHLGLARGERRWQLDRLFAALPPPPTRLVLCGDFNDWSGSAYRRARRAWLHDPLVGLRRAARRTFPSHLPLFALDRVLVRGLHVDSVRVLRGAPWRRLSDHLPVWCRLREEEVR